VKLSRAQAVALVALVALAAIVVVLAMRNPQPPVLPDDEYHASFNGPAACLECHGPDGAVPRSRNHPLGDECLRCHGMH